MQVKLVEPNFFLDPQMQGNLENMFKYTTCVPKKSKMELEKGSLRLLKGQIINIVGGLYLQIVYLQREQTVDWELQLGLCWVHLY